MKAYTLARNTTTQTMGGNLARKGNRFITNCGNVQPPRKHTAHMEDMMSIPVYSPRKKSANLNPLYSVKYPATSSLSASGRSKGSRLVSANAETTKTKKPKNWGIA